MTGKTDLSFRTCFYLLRHTPPRMTLSGDYILCDPQEIFQNRNFSFLVLYVLYVGFGTWKRWHVVCWHSSGDILTIWNQIWGISRYLRHFMIQLPNITYRVKSKLANSPLKGLYLQFIVFHLRTTIWMGIVENLHSIILHLFWEMCLSLWDIHWRDEVEAV